MLRPSVVVLIFTLLLGACGLATTRPKKDMSLAQAAFMAAKRANAQTLAPGLYRKAEFYYIKARSAYRTKNFNKAQQYAELSRKFSEQAELVAVRKAALENI
jgi:hypothetical protein